MESRRTLQRNRQPGTKGCLFLAFVCRKTTINNRLLLYAYKNREKGVNLLAKNIRKQNTEIPKPGNQFHMLIPRLAFTAFLTVTLLAVSATPVFASNIFEVAKNAMQTVYKDVAGIATVAAVVCAAVCLLLMNFSKSGRTVDESRSWLKRIVVCWAALMTLGAIVTYFESIIPQSMFGG